MRYTLESCIDSQGLDLVVLELINIAREKAERARNAGDIRTAEFLEDDARQLEDVSHQLTPLTFEGTYLERR